MQLDSKRAKTFWIWNTMRKTCVQIFWQQEVQITTLFKGVSGKVTTSLDAPANWRWFKCKSHPTRRTCQNISHSSWPPMTEPFPPHQAGGGRKCTSRHVDTDSLLTDHGRLRPSLQMPFLGRGSVVSNIFQLSFSPQIHCSSCHPPKQAAQTERQSVANAFCQIKTTQPCGQTETLFTLPLPPPTFLNTSHRPLAHTFWPVAIVTSANTGIRCVFLLRCFI